MLFNTAKKFLEHEGIVKESLINAVTASFKVYVRENIIMTKG